MEESPATVLEVSLSSHIIAANDDLLIEILIRLPVKSLIRFKSVSKHWLSVIRSPEFCHRKNQGFSKAISGLLLHRSSFRSNPEYDFVPLGLDELDAKEALALNVTSPFKSLTFVKDKWGIKILQSCNGLLLCRSLRARSPGDCNYYIFNPTTKDFITIPLSLPRVPATDEVRLVHAVNLAFDPRESPHYKLICICFSKLIDYFELEIYSSETGLRRKIGDPFRAAAYFHSGVYWNGAINWMSYWSDGLYFKIDEERFGSLPMPPLPDGWEEEGRRMRYFGESNDHLHLIQIYGPRALEINVYEMDKGYTGWFVKFRIDLEPVVSSSPELCSLLDPSSLHYYKFHIMDVIRKTNDGESFLVLSILGKAIRYKFGDASCSKICDFAPDCNSGGSPLDGWIDCFQFMESLYPLSVSGSGIAH